MSLSELEQMIQRVVSGPARLSGEDAAIVHYMRKYFDEMYEAEKEFEGLEDFEFTEEAVNARNNSVLRKNEIHSRYWGNTSPFYHPNSTTTDPDHDWKRVKGTQILRNGDDETPLFLFLYSYLDIDGGRQRLRGYALRVTEGQLKIDHQFG